MVLDSLSGRSSLYRLSEFFKEKDTGILLGADIGPELFCDYNLGSSMDKIFETGTQKIFSQLAQNALKVFGIHPDRLHFDTTSVSAFGDYDLIDPPFEYTYGHSKDYRPDLKQFLISMLCIDRLLKQDRKQLEDACKKASATAYYCHEDAQAAGEKLIHNSGYRYHELQVEVEKVPKYSRGRPPKG